MKLPGISRILRRFAIAATLALAPALATAGERIESSVFVDGLKRSYIAYFPDNLASRDDWPVMFVLHPGLADGEYMEKTTKFHTLEDANKFIIIYPDGIRRTWNAGECCGQAMKRNVNDIGFVEALMDDFRSKTGNRIRSKAYVTGFSNGAIMAYHIACKRPDLVEAIAPFGSAYKFLDCADGHVPVLHIHGEKDASAPVLGGSSAIKAFNQRQQMAAADTVSLVAGRSACSATANRSEMVATLKTSCPIIDCNGHEITLCVVQDLGHIWPGAEAGDNFLGRKFGPGRTDISGSQAIFDYFKEHL
ncbi:hypothetical protein ACMU_11990 [Actibacterium mucosum KCTC 23349]|uniref:Polyhydroxybutyrate depolymerase n=2 Tax=Actibacterium TaxID=1433986 RepID=A0A037ZG54_9RHOB|nr:hypothetical protein ACMU_11990 [Actibacterium mucosum KCTC 23349]